MNAVILVLILLIPVLAIDLWWKLYNTPAGERYVKLRMQGPFVPSGDDEVECDGAAASGDPKV